MNKNKLRFKAIQHMKDLIKGKRYIVAQTDSGYILYNNKDYDKVIEGLGYATPIPVAKFRSFKKASNYLREVTEAEKEWSDAFDDCFVDVDLSGGDDWWTQ